MPAGSQIWLFKPPPNLANLQRIRLTQASHKMDLTHGPSLEGQVVNFDADALHPLLKAVPIVAEVRALAMQSLADLTAEAVKPWQLIDAAALLLRRFRRFKSNWWLCSVCPKDVDSL